MLQLYTKEDQYIKTMCVFHSFSLRNNRLIENYLILKHISGTDILYLEVFLNVSLTNRNLYLKTIKNLITSLNTPQQSNFQGCHNYIFKNVLFGQGYRSASQSTYLACGRLWVQSPELKTCQLRMGLSRAHVLALHVRGPGFDPCTFMALPSAAWCDPSLSPAFTNTNLCPGQDAAQWRAHASHLLGFNPLVVFPHTNTHICVKIYTIQVQLSSNRINKPFQCLLIQFHCHISFSLSLICYVFVICL